MQYLAHPQDAPETETENNQNNCFRSFVFSTKFQVEGHKGFNFLSFFGKILTLWFSEKDGYTFKFEYIDARWNRYQIQHLFWLFIYSCSDTVRAIMEREKEGLKYCAESISPQYDTAQSQSPHSIILHRVNLSTVSYCTESISPHYHTAQSQSPSSIVLRGVTWLSWILYKGTFQRNFLPPVFSSFPGPLTSNQWVKILLILVKISLSYSNLSVEKTDSNKQNLYTRIFCKIEKYSSLLVE